MRSFVHRVSLSLALVTTVACASDPVSPGALPVGTARASVSGQFADWLSGSVSSTEGKATALFDPPRPTGPYPSAGGRMLYLHWNQTSSKYPNSASLSVGLPYDFGALPQTVSLTPPAGYAWLGAGPLAPPEMGQEVDGQYSLTSGAVTITAVTDSTIAGTLDLSFGTTSSMKANLHVTAAFDARRCYDNSIPSTCFVF